MPRQMPLKFQLGIWKLLLWAMVISDMRLLISSAPGEAAAAHITGHGWRGDHRHAADAKGLGDGGIAHTGLASSGE